MLNHLKTFENYTANRVKTQLFSPGFLEYFNALKDTGLFLFQQIVVDDNDGGYYDHLVFSTFIEENKPLEKFDLFVDDDNMGEFLCIEFRSSDLIEIDSLEAMFNYIFNRSKVLFDHYNIKGTKDIWKILLQKNPKYIEDCPTEFAKEIEFSLRPMSKTGVFN